MQYLSFSYLFHLALSSRSIHVVTNGRISSFFMTDNIPLFIYTCVCIHTIPLSIQLSITDYFHVLAIENNVAIVMGVQTYFPVSVFVSSVYIPQSETAKSYSSSVFNFLRILHTLSIVAAPIYIPTISASLHPHQHLSF